MSAVGGPDPRAGHYTPSTSMRGLDMRAERIKELETALAASEARAAAAEADKARLDFLDRCNASLNARFGTSYRWRLVLNHNVNRLMLGHGDVDLHDSDGSNSALPSCREAIDERMREYAAARALQPEPRS